MYVLRLNDGIECVLVGATRREAQAFADGLRRLAEKKHGEGSLASNFHVEEVPVERASSFLFRRIARRWGIDDSTEPYLIPSRK